jgi:alkanesulfonate monooxygenase SsuD/methylene tetrahydromethanopterin reductase-like flavin-dependent oxidoreductase (luciferase family)
MFRLRRSPAATTARTPGEEDGVIGKFHKKDLFHTNIGFDMRAPGKFATSAAKIYQTALEMIRYADAKGIDKVDFQEHHGSEDGYLPAPFLMGAAAGACTKRIGIVLGAVILPFHDPVEIAEQIAVGDLICGGRLRVVLAGGYSPKEFEAFQVSLKDRAQRMEDGFQIILRALSGERFIHDGRPVFVRPLPSRPAREIVFGGGGVAASARRAARFGLPLWPMNDSMIPAYEEECRKLGREPGPLIRGYTSVYVTDDPERGWAELGPHVLHVTRSYAAWSESEDTSASPMHGIDSIEKVKAAGAITVVTPEEAVRIGQEAAIGVTPLIGGLDPVLGWKSLELFADKVVPAIKGARDRAMEVREHNEGVPRSA